jgi:hypothetical protein
MSRQWIMISFFFVTTLSSATAPGGIPEPDNILYGHVCIGGIPATSEDDVTVIAKATVDAEVREVGRYRMGDYPPANDCHGQDDCYILKIRLESVPAGETASGQAVVLDRGNPTPVQIYLLQGDDPEVQIAEVEVADSGIIRRLDLRDTPASADLNNDTYVDLTDYDLFHAAFQGPSVESPTSCNGADLNGDGHVDLRDFALLQAAFTGSG